MSWFTKEKVYNPWDYSEGSQKERIKAILRDFDVVPLPYLLRMEPRVAGHCAVVTILRREGCIVNNFELPVKVKGRYEKHSFYELLYDPETGKTRESKEKEIRDQYKNND